MTSLDGGLEREALTELGVAAMVDPAHPIKTETAEWASTELGNRDLVDADRSSTFAADDWATCAERGLLGMLVSPEYGGTGHDLITTLLTLEGLGLGCRDNGLAFALASQMVSTQVAIERFGTEAHKREWLPQLCDGSKLGVFAITEAESGSDAYALEATAVKTHGGYVLNGRKSYLTLGSNSDVAVVFASTDPDAGRWGISAFLVPTATPGVEPLGNREKMGMRTTPFGDLSFTDVFVPEEDRMGAEGAGASIFASTLEVERGFVFITQIGMMERQLDETLRYAQERQQGGRSIIEHQSVSSRLADMKVRHESARLLTYKTALQVLRGEPATLSAALSKLVASENALASSLDATFNHGAVGYLSEFQIERNLRDAVGGLIYSGTSDIQRNIIVSVLRSEDRRRRMKR